jgi:hypothetical protein
LSSLGRRPRPKLASIDIFPAGVSFPARRNLSAKTMVGFSSPRRDKTSTAPVALREP